MYRIRFAVPGIVVALVVGCVGRNQPADGGGAVSLEGAWEVKSVERDGQQDPLQVGARLTFADNAVSFQPIVAQVSDWTG